MKNLFNRKKSKAPPGLSAEARAFWSSIIEEYSIADVAGLKLLGRACEALDRIRQAQKFLKRDGVVVSDKKGSVKKHPGIEIEKEAHSQFIESIKSLNLDLEPLRDRPGRPGGS